MKVILKLIAKVMFNMNTLNIYRVTYIGFKPVIVEAYDKIHAIKLAREILGFWGYPFSKPSVEVKVG